MSDALEVPSTGKHDGPPPEHARPEGPQPNPVTAALVTLGISKPADAACQAVRMHSDAPEPPEIPAGLSPQEALAFVGQQNGVHVLQDRSCGVYLAGALFPGVSRLVSTAAAQAYIDQFVTRAGAPTDPIERLMLEQITMAHHVIGGLYLQAHVAPNVNVAATSLDSAVKFTAEFRRLVMALKQYREPVAKSTAAVGQQSVSATDQSPPAEQAQPTAREKAPDSKLGTNKLAEPTDATPPQEFTAESEEVSSRQAQPIEARPAHRRRSRKGLITASNWHTASPERFGPLEKLSYLAGDFVDRHGYFECHHQGDNAAWSIRKGHTYSDRSALRFEAGEPGKPKQFVHPVMDPQYGDKPSMISETTFTRPNRFRSEAPLYFAAYGALQDSDCIVHFALDGARWQVKPRFWMQQWTLATPSMLGQFPAAALLYRRGLVAPGDVLAEVTLDKSELMRLQGTPLPQDASFDELRLKDVPHGVEVKPGQRLDPLLHYAGRTQVKFADAPASTKVVDSARYIDRKSQTVTSTSGELKLDYGKGLLVINAPRAQGASGALGAAGKIELPALTIECDLDLAHIIAVSLDDEPLATSKRILLQVNSEEQATGFATEAAGPGVKRITNIGRDPWQAKRLSGRVTFRRADATELMVMPLDFSGYSGTGVAAADATSLRLLPTTLYYLISR